MHAGCWGLHLRVQSTLQPQRRSKAAPASGPTRLVLADGRANEGSLRWDCKRQLDVGGNSALIPGDKNKMEFTNVQQQQNRKHALQWAKSSDCMCSSSYAILVIVTVR